MADWDKDPGVALLFPELAVRWSREVHATDSWKSFTSEDFHRLHEQFGVGWTVLALPGVGKSGLQAIPLSDCPYQNHSVMVCRVRLKSASVCKVRNLAALSFVSNIGGR